MKNMASKALVILISVACFAGFTSCGVGTGSSTETDSHWQTLEETDAGSGDKEEEITEDTTSAVYAANIGNDAVKAFKEAKLIKVGEHTYYPDYLFESDDRDKKLRIISCLF